MANDFIIVLPTHSKYSKITANFLKLLRKNWSDCQFEIVVSMTGEDIKIEGVKNIYNGKNASLIKCLVDASKEYKSKYYISFLGDAFISKKINNSSVMNLLNTIDNSNIDYCSLKYVKGYTKEKKCNQYFRYINALDRYSHNFTAFVVSYDYLNEEFLKFKDDLDFEEYYLKKKTNKYYDKHLIVRKNYFRLLPGIIKGEWDAINYKRLKKDNPEINFDNRPVLSFKESAIRHIRNNIVAHIPANARIGIKKFTEKAFGFKFGVDG